MEVEASKRHTNLQIRIPEVSPTTHNFIDEQSPSNFVKSISDLPMDSNLQLRDRVKTSKEEQTQPAPQSKLSLIFKETDTENESKKNIRISPVENNFMLSLIWLNKPRTQIDNFKQNKTKKNEKEMS